MTRPLNLILLIAILALPLSGCLAAINPFSDNTSSTEDAAVKVVPNEAAGQIKLAQALLRQGEFPRALAELEIARGMDPANADVENYLGLTYYRLQEYTLAIGSFQKALQLDSKRSDVHNNLGLVYLAQRDYPRALAEFNLCIKDLNYQKKQLPLNNIGLTYMELGQYDQALAALTRATEVAPDYAKSYQLIGRVYQVQGKYSQALAALEKAASLNSGDQETQAALAEVRASLAKPL